LASRARWAASSGEWRRVGPGSTDAGPAGAVRESLTQVSLEADWAVSTGSGGV
jgi:hypothetical protein